MCVCVCVCVAPFSGRCSAGAFKALQGGGGGGGS